MLAAAGVTSRAGARPAAGDDLLHRRRGGAARHRALRPGPGARRDRRGARRAGRRGRRRAGARRHHPRRRGRARGGAARRAGSQRRDRDLGGLIGRGARRDRGRRRPARPARHLVPRPGDQARQAHAAGRVRRRAGHRAAGQPAVGAGGLPADRDAAGAPASAAAPGRRRAGGAGPAGARPGLRRRAARRRPGPAARRRWRPRSSGCRRCCRCSPRPTGTSSCPRRPPAWTRAPRSRSPCTVDHAARVDQDHDRQPVHPRRARGPRPGSLARRARGRGLPGPAAGRRGRAGGRRGPGHRRAGMGHAGPRRRSTPPAWTASRSARPTRSAPSETTPVYLAPDAYDVVDTGDPMPDGRDAVVMREHVHYAGGAAELRAAVPPYQHVRSIGEDVERRRAAAARGAPAAGRRPGRRRGGGGHRSCWCGAGRWWPILPTGDEVRPIGTRDRARGDPRHQLADAGHAGPGGRLRGALPADRARRPGPHRRRGQRGRGARATC